MPEPRTLYLNYPWAVGAPNYTLHPSSAPTLDEFDVIIIDPVSPWHLVGQGSAAIQSNISSYHRYITGVSQEPAKTILETRWPQLQRFFDAGGVLLSILHRYVALRVSLLVEGRRRSVSFGNYHWLAAEAGDGPYFRLSSEAEHGNQLSATPKGQASPFKDLLKPGTFEWITTAGLASGADALAVNAAGSVVAFELTLGAGRAFFLPPPVQTATGYELASLALEAWKNRAKAFIADPWVANHALPGMEQAKQRIASIEATIATAYAELETERARLDELQHKRDVLLNGTGDALSDVVLVVLREIGLNAERGPKGLDDIRLLEGGEVIAVVEVKGIEGQIGRKLVRQVGDWTAEVEEQRKGTPLEGQEPQGVMLANPYRRKPLDERTEAAWAPNAVGVAERDSICLMTTRELFDLYGRFLQGDTSASTELRTTLLNRVGPATS